MVSFKQTVLVDAIIVLVASCSGDDEGDDQALATTTAGPTITTLSDSGPAATEAAAATTTVTTSTTTTTAAELTFPQYQIVSREATNTGDVVIVLLDTTSYESLSDLDIHGVMSDLVELYAPVDEAHIVESQAAVDALLAEGELTTEQQAELDANYIARLEEGFRIVYVGRFEEVPVAILGS